MAIELADLVLGQAGYGVLRASSGDEAITLLGRLRPDLVLLDINMPLVSGIDVLKRMKQLRLRIPVVMMTANGDQASVWACMEGGAVDYLLKPFTPQTLVARSTWAFWSCSSRASRVAIDSIAKSASTCSRWLCSMS